ncbi:MAG: prepilin-type N-terminal cleavage/methylation domain-containing protein [Pseudomonadales bacterium]|nr:prepilin-type N-terminal cleavage/methylation domain-containing protein [Pseudomonadales bacterium]
MKTNKYTSGFTLVELMLVLSIIAIVAAVAYPSYTDNVRKTHRKEAAGAVLDMAAAVEGVRAQRFSYASANGETRALDRYNIDVVADATSFTVTATPTGDQLNDRCLKLVYNDDNVWQFLGMDDSDLGLDEETCFE